MTSEADYIKELTQAVQNENLVIFVGAGVSRLIGVPSWRTLSESYLKHLYNNDSINYSTYKYLLKEETRKLLSICKQIEQLNPDKSLFSIKKALAERRVDSETKYCASIFSWLYRLSSIFVTTNYDDELDKEALSRVSLTDSVSSKAIPDEIRGPIIYHYEDITSTSVLKNGNVIHIHGSINDPNKERRIKNKSVVLTVSDYFEAYNREKSPLPEFLDTVFNQRVVLFVGYGLEEYEVLEYMLKDQHRDLRHFMFYAVRREEENFFPIQEKYYAELGIQLIKFDTTEIGYRQLYDDIQELAKKIGGKANPKNKLSKLSLVDKKLL